MVLAGSLNYPWGEQDDIYNNNEFYHRSEYDVSPHRGEANDFLFDNDEESSSWWGRWLAEEKKKDEVRVDYSVLSVGVMTLGLIMVVEVLRHRIDHAAVGRPFFKAVLEGVYSERT